MKTKWSVVRGQWSEGESRRGRRHHYGFSLVEVLLAIFILGIGMIMVASVFPVGANWTRQTTEESNAQTVVQNALTVLQVHYGQNGDLHSFMAPNFFLLGGPPTVFSPNGPTNTGNTVLKASAASLPSPTSPFVLQAFPMFANIPATERAYQFGSATPFPVPAINLPACTYFWTALVRLNPAHRGGAIVTNFVQPSASYTYDVYILVFRKGAVEHQFSGVGSEVANTRNPSDPIFTEALIPSVLYANWYGGDYDASQSPSIVNAMPPIGQYGIGAYSGTVFRQVLDPSLTNGGDPTSGYRRAMPRPMIIEGTAPPSPMNLDPGVKEPVIVSPPADGTSASASPLIYIYQTTMSF